MDEFGADDPPYQSVGNRLISFDREEIRFCRFEEYPEYGDFVELPVIQRAIGCAEELWEDTLGVHWFLCRERKICGWLCALGLDGVRGDDRLTGISLSSKVARCWAGDLGDVVARLRVTKETARPFYTWPEAELAQSFAILWSDGPVEEVALEEMVDTCGYFLPVVSGLGLASGSAEPCGLRLQFEQAGEQVLACVNFGWLPYEIKPPPPLTIQSLRGLGS